MKINVSNRAHRLNCHLYRKKWYCWIILPWLKKIFWSVFLPKTLDRMFQIPDRMIFLPIWVFGLETSNRVFCIKNSWPSVLKHPAGCLHFRHPDEHFTNAFEIWSRNYFTSYLMVFIFLYFWKRMRFLRDMLCLEDKNKPKGEK